MGVWDDVPRGSSQASRVKSLYFRSPGGEMLSCPLPKPPPPFSLSKAQMSWASFKLPTARRLALSIKIRRCLCPQLSLTSFQPGPALAWLCQESRGINHLGNQGPQNLLPAPFLHAQTGKRSFPTFLPMSPTGICTEETLLPS